MDLFTNKVHFIAEIGINHNGDIGLAKNMIDAAKQAGANTVKFQLYDVDEYISNVALKPTYQVASGYKPALSQKQIIKEAQLTEQMLADITVYCKEVQINCLVTPFDDKSLQTLCKLGHSTLKISSDNLNNIGFLEKVNASTAQNVILSTGMGNLSEVETAYNILKGKNLVLMQCTSNYPSPISAANTIVCKTYRDLFNVQVGLSDHTLNEAACASAAVFGARVFEKHFTLSRSLPGIDQAASLEPDELKRHIDLINDVIVSIGSPLKSPQETERSTKEQLRRSLCYSRPLKKGHKISKDDLRAKRPGTGISPSDSHLIVGKILMSDVSGDTLVKITDVE